MDEALMLHELARLEAERKLKTIPSLILETAWVRDAQVEAVIDAVLVVAFGADVTSAIRARHVGEWCARIAAGLSETPDVQLARRVGVLANVDSYHLERISELQHVAPYVRAYQSRGTHSDEYYRTMSTIVTVADYFESQLVRALDHGGGVTSVIRNMTASCDNDAVIEALRKCTGANKWDRVAS